MTPLARIADLSGPPEGLTGQFAEKFAEAAEGPADLAYKSAHLLSILKSLCPVAVAYSGGVDSSLLLAAAFEACEGRVLAVTAASATYPRREMENAKAIAALIGVRQIFVSTKELDDPVFSQNPIDRCYHCKRELFVKVARAAREEGISSVVEGSNVDDLGDFRPGEKALRELAISSPLREASLTKRDVRDIARYVGLPNWDKSAAACLASRFPYGMEITRDGLARIERVEDGLLGLGFKQVRARCHGDLLRVELEPGALASALAPDKREKIVQIARREGFRYVTLDLQGYRTGSFNP